MNTIKCRALGRDTNEWYYGYYIGEPFEPTIYEVDDKVAYVKPETVCMTTGLTAKDNQEVYEHDLWRHDENGLLYEVRWTPKQAKFELVYVDSPVHTVQHFINLWSLKQGTIVGNRFDNPELLNAN